MANSPTGHASVEEFEGTLDGGSDNVGEFDGLSDGSCVGSSDGCIDVVGQVEGSEEGLIEGMGDGHVVPRRMELSSPVKLPPSWTRVESKYNSYLPFSLNQSQHIPSEAESKIVNW